MISLIFLAVVVYFIVQKIVKNKQKKASQLNPKKAIKRQPNLKVKTLNNTHQSYKNRSSPASSEPKKISSKNHHVKTEQEQNFKFSESQSKQSILRYENALGLARSLKFNEALKILDILLKDEPTFWQAQLIRARILNEIGKSNVAVESCDAVLKLQPACLSAFDEKAKAQMNLRDYRGAILSLSKLLNQLPSPRNFEQRAIAYKGLSQWEFAIADYQKAQQLYQQRKQLHQARRLTSEIQKLYRHQLKSQFHELEFKKVQRRAITFPFEQGSSSLQIKLLRLLDRDQEKARRLLALMKQKNPTQSVNWCFEKVIHDLERDRSR